LRRARERWRERDADLRHARYRRDAGFDRVIVIAGGRIVEDGAPSALAASPDSQYSRMLDSEAGLRQRLWADPAWRTIRLRGRKTRAGVHLKA
jgi:ATP-binding cassette subfamily B protein